MLQFKKGDGWKACYDEERDLYTAERGGCGYYHLYEITKDVFDALADGMRDDETYKLIGSGRHLYMDVNDRCGPPYTIVFDDDYKTLCPWAHVVGGEHVWPAELTDAAVELFESEKQNREQRRRKREKRKACMTHTMQLTPAPFELIKSGRKTIELRLYDDKRRKIQIGDNIVFVHTENPEETLEVKVTDLFVFDSFAALYDQLPLLECGYTEADIGSASSKDMDVYYPAEMQEKYGVVGIKIRLENH